MLFLFRLKSKMSDKYSIAVAKNFTEKFVNFEACKSVEDHQEIGFLLGKITNQDEILICTAVFAHDQSEEGLRGFLSSLSSHFPAGYKVLGFLTVFAFESAIPSSRDVESQCNLPFALLSLCEWDVKTLMLYLICIYARTYHDQSQKFCHIIYQLFVHPSRQTSLQPQQELTSPVAVLALTTRESLKSDKQPNISCYLYNRADKTKLSSECVEPFYSKEAQDFIRGSLAILVRTHLSLEVNLYDNDQTAECQLSLAFQNLRNRVDRNSCCFKPLSKHLPIILGETKSILSENVTEDSTVFDLWSTANESDVENKRKTKELRADTHRLEFKLLEKVTGSELTEPLLNVVPVIYYEKKPFKRITVPLILTGMVVCEQNSSISSIFAHMRSAIQRQLTLCEESIFHHSNFKTDELLVPEIVWTLPINSPCFIAAAYPAKQSDSELEKSRLRLHMTLNLSLNRPILRKNNAFVFPDQRGPYLINIHTHITKTPDADSAISLVQGNYQYHHYMQDDFNDNGWGCAYRSFQTVWSWFLLQGYTDKPVPSHDQIQQALVDVGDREPKFVGTKQWIGSLELSYCLNQMLDVTSRIVTASSGSEMSAKARELSLHFRTQGTPVMIGGGVLAHTILGVAFNEDTGDVMFLILDPHYTGDETVKTIIDKGWCGWKPPSFWQEGAFYNMLLPQTPHVI